MRTCKPAHAHAHTYKHIHTRARTQHRFWKGALCCDFGVIGDSKYTHTHTHKHTHVHHPQVGDVLSACFVGVESLVTGTRGGDLLLWDMGGRRAGSFGSVLQVRAVGGKSVQI